MVRRTSFVASFSALFIGVAACGNSEDNDDTSKGSSGSAATSASGGSSSGGSSSGGSRSGTGGAGGSTDTGGAAGTNAGGSGGAGSCPPGGLPPSGSTCSVPNLRCSYGQSICTCIVSLGVPGGMTWLCDGGGSGGSGGQGGSGQGGSAAGGPIEGCTQNHEGDAACALASLPPYYYFCDRVPDGCTHYGGGGMTTYVCCP
jgi:hypothetical protein